MRLLQPLTAAVKARLCWPTTAGWVLLITAAAAFVLCAVTATLSICLFAAGLWALALASVTMALFSLGNVVIRREPCEDGHVGELLNLPLRLENRGRWERTGLVVAEHCPFGREPLQYAIVDCLPARESLSVRRAVPAMWRGEYRLDNVSLRSGDPAGFFYRERVFSLPQPLLIYPRVIPLQPVPLRLHDRVIAAAAGQSIGVSGQGQEFFGIREYRPTDGMRFIHWKASARQKGLMVREFEESTVGQVSVALDASLAQVSTDDSFSNLEFQVAVAASLSAYLSKLYCRASFVLGAGPGQRLFEGPSQTVHQQVMQALATLDPDEGDFLDALAEAVEDVPDNSIFYCLTLHEPEGISELLQVLLRKGVDVRWIHAPAAFFSTPRDHRRAAAVSELARRRQLLVRPLTVTARSQISQVLSHG